MEDNKTFYDLLCEGIKVGELVDAIEAGKVRIFDKFGRDNQAPSSEDISELKSQLLYHQNMILEKNLPVSMRSDDCNMYWQADWKTLLDCGGDLPPMLTRAWLLGKPKQQGKPTNSSLSREAAITMTDVRYDPQREQKEDLARKLPDTIDRAKRPHTHNLIAQNIHSTGHFNQLSFDQIIEVVKDQCYARGRRDLIKGVTQPK